MAVPGPASLRAPLPGPAPDPGRTGRTALGHPGGHLRQPAVSAAGRPFRRGPLPGGDLPGGAPGGGGGTGHLALPGAGLCPGTAPGLRLPPGPWWGPGCPRVSWAPPAAVFIWTGVLNRAMWKYRERAIRYLFLDAGHICQNLMLAATALGLGVCPVGAFFDDEVEASGPGGRPGGSGPLPGRGGAIMRRFAVFSFR